MNYAGDVAQTREHYVDEEICSAPSLQEDTQWWQKDGEYDLEDVTVRILSVNRDESYSRRGDRGRLRHCRERVSED